MTPFNINGSYLHKSPSNGGIDHNVCKYILLTAVYSFKRMLSNLKTSLVLILNQFSLKCGKGGCCSCRALCHL